VQLQPLSLDEKCKKLEEKIQRVAINTVGYTRKQATKEWFDEECAKINEEKNAYNLVRTKERRLFRKKSKAARRGGFNRD
jgi:hypothetical protein